MRFFYNLFKLLLRMDHRLATLNATVQAFSEAHQSSTAVTPEEYLGDQEVMAILGISYSSLRRFRDEGKIPCSRVGRRYYYRPSDIHSLIHTKRSV